MSIYFSIQCNNTAEWEALESEGAPWMNLSNSNGWTFQQDILGIEPDYCGNLDPQWIIDNASAMLDRAIRKDSWGDNYWHQRTDCLVKIAVAAKALGRGIVFS